MSGRRSARLLRASCDWAGKVRVLMLFCHFPFSSLSSFKQKGYWNGAMLIAPRRPTSALYWCVVFSNACLAVLGVLHPRLGYIVRPFIYIIVFMVYIRGINLV